MLVLVSITRQTSDTWRYTSGKIEQFRETRGAFETMTTRIGQATLNTYWDYGLDAKGRPTRYERRSDLRFISGPNLIAATSGPAKRVGHAIFFQAALGFTNEPKYNGLENLLNTWGYFVERGDDKLLRPSFITQKMAPYRERFRLMEFSQPAESNSIYFYTSGRDQAPPRRQNKTYSAKEWFQKPLDSPTGGQPPPVHVTAENVVALILLPRLSKRDEQEVKGQNASLDESPLAPDYGYDSSPAGGNTATRSDKRLNSLAQLPPVVQVTMVAIDEPSALRMSANDAESLIGFTNSHFSKSSDYSEDLTLTSPTNSLEKKLVAMKANYRVFTTNVQIRGAKWSREQIK